MTLIFLAAASAVLAVPAGAQNHTVGTQPAGNLPFTFSFYQAVREEEGNLFFSPASIQNAFWLAWAGARGETASQMGRALFGADTLNDLAASSQPLTPLQAGGSASADPNQPPPLTLRSANALWAQASYPWLPDYLDYAQQSGAPVQFVDYVADAEAVREQINTWVEDQTEDKIQNLIPQGLLDALTRMVIANAVYFKANWLNPFEAALTEDGAFRLLDGSTATVPFMRMASGKTFRAHVGEDYTAVALPYAGGSYEMLIILPDDFAAFETGLTDTRYQAILDAMEPTFAQVTMPRFTFEFSSELTDALKALGVVAAFDPGAADFGGMFDQGATSENLFISAVLHKAFIAVDEQGTEAAAATAIIIEATSLQVGEPLDIRIDRPFVFAIQDTTTSTVLFAGRVLTPTQPG
jgi:serpin B